MSEDRPGDEFKKKRKKCRHKNKVFSSKKGQLKCVKCRKELMDVYCRNCGKRLGLVCGCLIY